MNRTQQRGFLDSWGFIFAVIGLCLCLLAYEQYRRAQGIEHLRNNPPALSADQVKLIDDYKAKPSPVVGPAGMYRGTFDASGKAFRISYYFGPDSSLTKTMEVDDIQLTGTARYALSGSALTYSQIQGDKGLFNPQGEAFAIEGESLLLPAVTNPGRLERDAAPAQSEKELNR